MPFLNTNYNVVSSVLMLSRIVSILETDIDQKLRRQKSIVFDLQIETKAMIQRFIQQKFWMNCLSISPFYIVDTEQEVGENAEVASKKQDGDEKNKRCEIVTAK